MGQSASEIADWAEDKQIPESQVLLSITAQLPYTEKQRKLLAVLCLPQTAQLPVLRQCEIAGITSPYYYERVNNPDFQAAMVKFSRSMYGAQGPKFATRYSQIALNGDRQALERINEQIGVLDPKETTVNINRREALGQMKDRTFAGLEAFDAEFEVIEESTDADQGDSTTMPPESASNGPEQGPQSQAQGAEGIEQGTGGQEQGALNIEQDKSRDETGGGGPLSNTDAERKSETH